MKYTLILLCATVFVVAGYAQRIPLINSGEVIGKAQALLDSNRLSSAIKELLTIPKRDTNYVLAQTKLADLYRKNDQPNEAIATSDFVLSRTSSFKAEIICAKASVYTLQREYDKALAILLPAREEYPFDVQIRFQVAANYHDKHDYKNAIKAYYDVLEIYPYSAVAHLNLGHLSVWLGNKTHAMLSFGIYLSLKESDNAKLRFLENIASNQVDEEGRGAPESPGGNAFERLDQILVAKIAMEKKFKTEVPVDAATVKQFEMLLQQLNTASTSVDDPWLKFYGPVYASIRDKKMITPFLNHILSSADIESVKKWNSKNEKAREAFFEMMRAQLTRDRGTVKAPASFGTATTNAEYGTDNKVQSIGAIVNGQPHKFHIYYHANSEKSAEGNFDNGKKTGTWKYYRDDGVITSLENEETGEITGFYPDGKKRVNYIQKDEKIEGEIRFYYPCGSISETRIHKAGKREGKGHLYFENGSVKADFEYSDDKLTGNWIEYDVYGHVRSRTPYKNGIVDGLKETFWVNGKPKERETFADDQQNGSFESYHDNGQLHYKGVYSKGLAVGEWLYYTRTGELNERRLFNNEGNIDQENPLYFEGKPFVKHTHKNGMLTGSVYIDKNGKELSKTGSVDGTFESKHFYQTGELIWSGKYQQGQRTGTWTQYYREGNVKSTYNYLNGDYDGEQVDYFRSGKKRTVTLYKNGVRDGYVQEFYANGKVNREGWYANGYKQQQWIEYYPDGSIATDYYFINDNVVDTAYTYGVDGTIISRDFYVDDDLLTLIPQSWAVKYDSTCGVYNGKFERFYPDGKTRARFSYVNGKLTGRYQAFDENGVPGTHGNYLDGQRHGPWNYLNEAGRPDQSSRYVNGSVDSLLLNYFEFGNLHNTVPYSGDQRNGVAQYLAPNGQPIVEKKYNDDELSAVRMTGKNGQFGDWTPVSDKTSVVAYYANGQKAYEEEFVGGALSGSKRIYFPDGKICRESVYVDGELEGDVVNYYPNGKVCMKSDYRFGELDGLTEIFDESGKLVKTINYRLGSKHGATTLFVKGVKAKEVIYKNDLPVK